MPLIARLKRFALQSLRLEPIRTRVALVRYLYWTKVRRRLRTLEANAEGVAENTIFHNLRGMGDLTVRRSDLLVRPLSVIESLGPDSKILSIGPRTEGELLNLVAHGFAPGNVRGLDLISYSPWVDLGNMHHLPYADDSWDAVIMGWVIAYSDQQERAALEAVRVTRPGGIIAIGLEWNPKTREELAVETGYALASKERSRTTDELLALFGDHVDRVYFRHDPLPEQQDRVGAITAVFSVKKARP